MVAELSHTCPICGRTGLRSYPRYPRYLCSECAAQVVSEDGRPLRFTNEGPFGGFVAAHADDGSPYAGGGRCWVRGVECTADDARFGGIVVQTRPSS
ncbi:MAG: hypothetical protein H6712_31115 [Myxococcales bacterium]|nr:hypothetical protein [Myxococcales bacterium]MCB9718342.1 hypothetical protein [Myxococcales bacterium]